MIFRLATPYDVQRLVQLGCEFLESSRYKATFSPKAEAIASAMEKMIESEDCLIVLGEVEGVVVGMIGVTSTVHPFSGEGVMSELFWYVQPEHRGKGTTLLRIAERWGRIRGATQSVMISPSKKVSRFFRRRGYQRLEEQFIKGL